jgi:hypothetical protein
MLEVIKAKVLGSYQLSVKVEKLDSDQYLIIEFIIINF